MRCALSSMGSWRIGVFPGGADRDDPFAFEEKFLRLEGIVDLREGEELGRHIRRDTRDREAVLSEVVAVLPVDFYDVPRRRRRRTLVREVAVRRRGLGLARHRFQPGPFRRKPWARRRASPWAGRCRYGPVEHADAVRALRVHGRFLGVVQLEICEPRRGRDGGRDREGGQDQGREGGLPEIFSGKAHGLEVDDA